MPNHPTITNIVAVVREAGPGGITAEEVSGATGLGFDAVRAALILQVPAGFMTSEEVWDGERFVGTVYRMREGA